LKESGKKERDLRKKGRKERDEKSEKAARQKEQDSVPSSSKVAAHVATLFSQSRKTPAPPKGSRRK
jgi:hypothetical protein